MTWKIPHRPLYAINITHQIPSVMYYVTYWFYIYMSISTLIPIYYKLQAWTNCIKTRKWNSVFHVEKSHTPNPENWDLHRDRAISLAYDGQIFSNKFHSNFHWNHQWIVRNCIYSWGTVRNPQGTGLEGQLYSKTSWAPSVILFIWNILNRTKLWITRT